MVYFNAPLIRNKDQCISSQCYVMQFGGCKARFKIKTLYVSLIACRANYTRLSGIGAPSPKKRSFGFLFLWTQGRRMHLPPCPASRYVGRISEETVGFSGSI